jgi:hypothetical protein
LAITCDYFHPIVGGRYRIHAAGDRALRELIELCRRHGIQPALFMMPEASGLRAIYAPETCLRVQHYLEDLQRAYQVAVIDMRAWSADSDFADGFHLLRSGAWKFSQRFGREVLEPLLASKAGGFSPEFAALRP